MRYFLIFIVFFAFACSKMEDIGSLRIVGSNTEQNYFNETTDNQTLLLKKNEMYFLDNSFVSNLSLVKIVSDSVDFERVAGDSDTLLLMTKMGVQAYFPKLKQRIAFKNYGFSICDQMGLLDSLVVISNGKTECQPDINGRFSLLKINKKSELVLLNQYTSDQIIDIKVMRRRFLMLSKTGTLGVYEVKNGNEISKISEIAVSKPEFMRVIPNLQKILVKTEDGLVQLRMLPNFTLEKINEI